MPGILASDPLTQLSFSLYENKGVFAVLIGSGLSRAAGIPTGWEITLDLVRRVALAQGTGEQQDWARWYRDTIGEEPNYSSLLEELSSTPEERRSILHSYIEPAPEEREEGKKLPTGGHRAIAQLVSGGYIRVIVTTNFDRLMENALREVGVEPTVVASPDALAGAEPLAHSTCYVLKLHGDYKDARILNTDSELAAYPAAYDALLDRIWDEYGLIVCGWSGGWDHALRSALMRAPNRRYPVYWATRGDLNDQAQEIVTHRRARVIHISDANGFLRTIVERVQTLQQSHRQNPIGIELLVGSVKRYLGKPEHRIQLNELFAEELDRLFNLLDTPELSPQGGWSAVEFRARVARYESATEPLARMVGVLGRWGQGNDISLVLDIVSALMTQADKVGGGLLTWIKLRSYPAVLVFTAYGLGLVRSQRWEELYKFLSAQVRWSGNERQRLVDELFLGAWEGGDNDCWKNLEGLRDRKTALSDHLFHLFSSWSEAFVTPIPDFDVLFELLEVLASFSCLESTEQAEVEKALASNTPPNWVSVPIGRSGWHRGVRERLLMDIDSKDMKTLLLKAGFANGSEQFFRLAIANYRRLSGRMGS